MANENTLLTPIGLLASRPRSIEKIFVNRKEPEKEGSFYARLLFTAEDLKKPEWAKIVKVLTEAGTTKFGAKFSAMVKEGGIRWPLRRDMATAGYDGDQFAGYVNLNAYADNPPVVVDIDGAKLPNAGILSLGCRVRASVYVTSYDNSGNRGVNLKLRGIQYAGPGPQGLVLPTKGAGDAVDDFGKLADVEGGGGNDALSDLLNA